MNKDFQAFQENNTLATAQAVMKHAGKISAQTVWGPELERARRIVATEKNISRVDRAILKNARGQ